MKAMRFDLSPSVTLMEGVRYTWRCGRQDCEGEAFVGEASFESRYCRRARQGRNSERPTSGARRSEGV